MKKKVVRSMWVAGTLLVLSLACAAPNILEKTPDIETPEGSVNIREISRTNEPDTCDLTQYLGLRIDILKNIKSADHSECLFNLYFENQHKTLTAVPVVKLLKEDCYAGTSGYEWIILSKIGPGEEIDTWGEANFYVDKDCKSGVVKRDPIRALLIEDDAFCRSRVTEGNAEYSETYMDQKSKEITLGCPVP